MLRNSAFNVREPFRSHRSLQLQRDRISGPVSFLNPTIAAYNHVLSGEKRSTLTASGGDRDDPEQANEDSAAERKDEQPASNVEFTWRSRDNRKGRHTLVVDPSAESDTRYLAPNISSTFRGTAQGILRMGTQFPYWDVSYLVAVIFTLGSVVWVINAFLEYLPLAQPSTEFNNEITVGGGVSAFIGATIFELGSVLLMFEAFNENREGCFGWALEKVLSGDAGHGEILRIRPDKRRCMHHHTNKKNLIGKGSIEESSVTSHTDSPGSSVGKAETPASASSPDRSWDWFPSMNNLTTHYLRELGFLACLAQFCGATIFWISGFTALPGINNKMSQGLLDGVFWVPQIVGGTGFIISGILFMLETQKSWYEPAFGVLGWHIGFWNLIGAFGFTLCGALGPAYGSSGAQYEASLATFWGSWAFLIGSAIQWYESLDKHPVESKANTP